MTQGRDDSATSLSHLTWLLRYSSNEQHTLEASERSVKYTKTGSQNKVERLTQKPPINNNAIKHACCKLFRSHEVNTIVLTLPDIALPSHGSIGVTFELRGPCGSWMQSASGRGSNLPLYCAVLQMPKCYELSAESRKASWPNAYSN